MGTVRVSACGPSPEDGVWLRYATPARWHEWSPQITAVNCPNPDDVVRAGLSGVVKGPLGTRVRFRVSDVDVPERRWTWRVRVGLLDLEMAHGVDVVPHYTGSSRGGPGSGERTRAWVALTGALPVVASYAPAARLALGRLVSAGPA